MDSQAGRQVGRQSANQQRGAAAGRSNARWFTLLGYYLRSQIRAVSMQRAEGTETETGKKNRAEERSPNQERHCLAAPASCHTRSRRHGRRARATCRASHNATRATRHAAAARHILGPPAGSCVVACVESVSCLSIRNLSFLFLSINFNSLVWWESESDEKNASPGTPSPPAPGRESARARVRGVLIVKRTASSRAAMTENRNRDRAPEPTST